jgi:hypothetical protein
MPIRFSPMSPKCSVFWRKARRRRADSGATYEQGGRRVGAAPWAR